MIKNFGGYALPFNPFTSVLDLPPGGALMQWNSPAMLKARISKSAITMFERNDTNHVE